MLKEKGLTEFIPCRRKIMKALVPLAHDIQCAVTEPLDDQTELSSDPH